MEIVTPGSIQADLMNVPLSLQKSKIEDDEISIPDHGELWSRPWNYRLENDSIILSIKGRIFDYTFEKRISLDGGKVIINYSVLNNTAKGLPYIWSAHPLLKVEPQAEIYLPSSDYKMILDSSSDETIGLPGAELPWPYLKQTTDYSKVTTVEFDKAIKLFEQNPKAGFCAFTIQEKMSQFVFIRSSENKIWGFAFVMAAGLQMLKEKSYSCSEQPADAR